MTVTIRHSFVGPGIIRLGAAEKHLRKLLTSPLWRTETPFAAARRDQQQVSS